MVYKEIKKGVYIQGVSGKLYTYNEWNNQETANGVAVLADNCSFVMSLDKKTNLKWGSTTYVNNIGSTLDATEAANDFNGAHNTAEIISQLGGTVAQAASYCANYTFPNGKTGYLGAGGEWQTVINNKTEINKIRSLFELGALYDYWTSTQKVSSNTDAFTANVSNGYLSNSVKSSSSEYLSTMAFTTI